MRRALGASANRPRSRMPLFWAPKLPLGCRIASLSLELHPGHGGLAVRRPWIERRMWPPRYTAQRAGEHLAGSLRSPSIRKTNADPVVHHERRRVYWPRRPFTKKPERGRGPESATVCRAVALPACTKTQLVCKLAKRRAGGRPRDEELEPAGRETGLRKSLVRMPSHAAFPPTSGHAGAFMAAGSALPCIEIPDKGAQLTGLPARKSAWR